MRPPAYIAVADGRTDGQTHGRTNGRTRDKCERKACAGVAIGADFIGGRGRRYYFQIISQPMDLGTIERRLETDHYSADAEGARQCAADMLRTFSNCITFNAQGSALYRLARQLQRFLQVRAG